VSENLVIATGSYTGNGSSQSIATGWEPCWVWIGGNKSGGNPAGRSVSTTKTTTISGTTAFKVAGNQSTSYGSNGLALSSTGFTVSTNDTNENGIGYYWIAVRKGPQADTGTYTGDGSTSGQAVTTGRQPSMVLIIGDDATLCMKIRGSGDDESAKLQNGGSTWWSSGNGIQIDSTGFTPKGALGNSSAVGYHYLALYDLVGSTVHSRAESYTGDNGVGNPGVTVSLGGPPKFAIGYVNNGTLGAVMYFAGGWGTYQEACYYASNASTTWVAETSFYQGLWLGTITAIVYANALRPGGATCRMAANMR